MNDKTNCDFCINYTFDDDYNCYECAVNLDEDEMQKFLEYSFDNCPYFKFKDEYKTVRKQI